MTSTTITTLASRCKAAAFFCAIAAILCLASGCSKDEKEKEPVVSVQTTPAQRAPISQVISAEAVVYPLEQATIAPKISSTIKKFHVQRGAHVKKGQLLADLENKDLSAAAESSKGDFEQADANYVTTVDASLPQQIQKAQLGYSRILSPIDGVVTDRPLFEGDLATANQPILTVMNTSRLIAKAHIPQSDAAVLKVGNPAELKIPGLDEPVKGRVSLVSPALDPGSTTIEVWVEASKPDPALKPGMTVELSMTAKMVKDALVVPTPAIYKNSEGADYVLLVGSDGHAHVKTVEVGVRNAEFAQIVSGVKAGNQVINSGGYGLPDNTQIKIEAAPAEKDADDKSSKPEKPGASAKPAAKNAKGKE